MEHKDYMPLEAYIPYAEAMSRGDEDLRQELFLEAYRTMKKGYTYPAKVIYSMQMARIAYHRGWGKSIDNGNPWRRPRGTLSGLVYDESEQFHPAILEYCTYIQSPEDLALFRISYERFYNSLTQQEKLYVEKQLGESLIRDAPRMSRYMLTKVRKSIRQKFDSILGDEEENQDHNS